MIKVFLKHHIYEKCINVIFNAIAMNFHKIQKYKIGDYFSTLKIKFNPNQFDVYHNVKVLHLRQETMYIEYDQRYFFSKLKAGERCKLGEWGRIKGVEYKVKNLEPLREVKYVGDVYYREIADND